MRFLSVCSGIEAASVAFEPLGWKALAFSEIEKFPRAVLQHHYPDVPLHGDFTELRHQPWIEDADLLCGGTPCQAFSVAGLRQSLSDDRGNLTLQFVLLANAIDHLRSTAGRPPAWILWENVPGVLSTNDNAFGAFLGGLVGRTAPIPEPEGGWTGAGVVDGPTRCAAWRILDAQHFGLAQRRKRVFVLARGGAGRWAVADALLPIIEGGEWHPAPSRSKGEGVAATITSGAANGGPAHGARSGSAKEGNLIPEVTRPLTAAMGTKWNGNGDLESSLIPSVAHAMRGEGGGDLNPEANGGGSLVPVRQWPAEIASTLDTTMQKYMGYDNQHVNAGCPLFVPAEAPMLMRMREGKDGGKGPLVSQDQSLTLATGNDQVLCAPTLTASNDPSRSPQSSEVTAQVLAVMRATGNDQVLCAAADTVTAKWAKGAEALQQGAKTGGNCIPVGMQVRRLTPVECERLQGFPDGYTNVPWRGKPESPDGPRYKALGNSWAVPCARWIGERIKAIRP